MFTSRSVFFTCALAVLFQSCSHDSSKHADNNGSNSEAKIIDTGKVKSDLNTMLGAISDESQGKKPDTQKMKQALKDLGTTAVGVLSDSTIDKLGPQDKDPAVEAAREAEKKMLHGLGFTPRRLDSLKREMQKMN